MCTDVHSNIPTHVIIIILVPCFTYYLWGHFGTASAKEKNFHEMKTNNGQVPVLLTIFARNSNAMEIRFAVIPSLAIRSKKNCTCHDSTAVVPCTKFCIYHCIRFEVKRHFHQIWIAMEKPLVKWGPVRHVAMFIAVGFWLMPALLILWDVHHLTSPTSVSSRYLLLW